MTFLYLIAIYKRIFKNKQTHLFILEGWTNSFVLGKFPLRVQIQNDSTVLLGKWITTTVKNE